MLHTAAYWLVLTIRATIPRVPPLAKAEFAAIRLRLLKLVRHRIAVEVTRLSCYRLPSRSNPLREHSA